VHAVVSAHCVDLLWGRFSCAVHGAGAAVAAAAAGAGLHSCCLRLRRHSLGRAASQRLGQHRSADDIAAKLLGLSSSRDRRRVAQCLVQGPLEQGPLHIRQRLAGASQCWGAAVWLLLALVLLALLLLALLLLALLLLALLLLSLLLLLPHDRLELLRAQLLGGRPGLRRGPALRRSCCTTLRLLQLPQPQLVGVCRSDKPSHFLNGSVCDNAAGASDTKRGVGLCW
jgi:hypothetical protein